MARSRSIKNEGQEGVVVILTDHEIVDRDVSVEEAGLSMDLVRRNPDILFVGNDGISG